MIDHIRHKSDAEHHPRLFVRKTTALHVEERLFIKLTGRHAMRTFHIVGINLELRLAVHTGIGGETHVTVRLVSLCFLRAFIHKYPPAENTYCALVKDVLKQLVAGAMRYNMRDMGVRIHLLITKNAPSSAKISTT